MSDVARSSLPRSTLPRVFAFAWDAWRGLTRKHYLFTLALSLGVGLFDGLARWAEVTTETNVALWKILAAQWYETSLIGFSLLLAIAVADRIATAKRSPWVPYAAAAPVGLAVGLAVARFTWSVTAACECAGLPRPFWLDFTAPFSGYCALATFVTFGYAYRQRATQRIATLRAAQIEHAKLVRQTFESRLQAMQARVEPQFLFNTLAQVERLYETDARLADQMLDDLIVYLRAALPQLRETTSTLAKEIELARAYLNIMKVRLGDRLTFEIAMPDDAGDVRIPPMVLLPLIDHAIVYGLEPSQSGGSIRIGTSIAEGRLRLTVSDSGAGFVPGGPGEEGIQGIRERLDGLYGADAQLLLQHNQPCGTQAVMEIPYERPEGTDR